MTESQKLAREAFFIGKAVRAKQDRLAALEVVTEVPLNMAQIDSWNEFAVLDTNS